jgi:hypothetical protein
VIEVTHVMIVLEIVKATLGRYGPLYISQTRGMIGHRPSRTSIPHPLQLEDSAAQRRSRVQNLARHLQARDIDLMWKQAGRPSVVAETQYAVFSEKC